MQAHIASDDAAAAAAFLAESGALLSAGARLAYRLAIDDLQAGKADITQALAAVAHRYERYDRNDLRTEADELEWIRWFDDGGIVSAEATHAVRKRDQVLLVDAAPISVASTK